MTVWLCYTKCVCTPLAYLVIQCWLAVLWAVGHWRKINMLFAVSQNIECLFAEYIPVKHRLVVSWLYYSLQNPECLLATLEFTSIECLFSLFWLGYSAAFRSKCLISYRFPQCWVCINSNHMKVSQQIEWANSSIRCITSSMSRHHSVLSIVFKLLNLALVPVMLG